MTALTEATVRRVVREEIEARVVGWSDDDPLSFHLTEDGTVVCWDHINDRQVGMEWLACDLLKLAALAVAASEPIRRKLGLVTA